MLRRCAWCGLSMGWAEPLDDVSVTHGICPACSERMLEEFWCSRAFRQTALAGAAPRPEGVVVVRAS